MFCVVFNVLYVFAVGTGRTYMYVHVTVFSLISELKEAIAAKDLDKLDTTMHNLSETSLKKELGELYNDASVLRSRLRKLKRLRHAVLEMDQKTISELRSYPKPPKPVHGVMAATFLLLGHKETDLKVRVTAKQ